MKTSRSDLRHALAEARQQLWLDLAANPRDNARREAVRSLTRTLNGHDHDLSRHESGRKSSYFANNWHVWAESRATKPRSVDYTLVTARLRALLRQREALAQLMTQSEKLGTGGRKRSWESGWSNLASSSAAEVLGSQTAEKFGHISTELAGGSHDVAWTTYYALQDGYQLEQHREAMRRGRLPNQLQGARKDALRILLAMVQIGAPDARIAHVFGISRKTVERAKCRSNPLEGERVLRLTAAILETNQRVDALTRQLEEQHNEVMAAVGQLVARFPKRADDLYAAAPKLRLVQ